MEGEGECDLKRHDRLRKTALQNKQLRVIGYGGEARVRISLNAPLLKL